MNHPFRAGDRIVADDVNHNFSVIAGELDALRTELHAFVNDNRYVSADENENVGIGTDHPIARLHVLEAASRDDINLESDRGQLVIQNDRVQDGEATVSKIVFAASTTNNWPARGAIGIDPVGQNNGRGDLFLRAGLQEGMRIKAISGRVGIGTSTPEDKLEVTAGNIRVTRVVDEGNEGLIILAGDYARPSCDESKEGAISYARPSGNSGHFYGCRRTHDQFDWVQLDLD